MKRIMIAALAILMLVAVSVGGVLPALAEGAHDHVHASVTADAVDAPKVGATSTEPLGADLSGYKGTPKPANAQPINNAMDFLNMAADGTYFLATDLTLTRSYTATFTGKLYGMGHTVTVSAPMFLVLSGAEIFDLTLEGSISKADYAGALAEQGYVPRITGVTNNAPVTSTTNHYTGGLIGAIWTGEGETSFRYCVNNADIDNASAASGKTDAGGLVGIVRGQTIGETKNNTWTQKVDKYDKLTVEHCVNNGTIYGSNRIGGLIGVMGENAQMFGVARIINCTNNGAVTSTQHYAGGLTARLSSIDSVIENCINTGDVLTLAASKYGGGIVGLIEDPEVKAVFRNCRNEGDINMTTTAGGILGNGSKWGTCYRTGTTVEKDDANIMPSDFYFYDCVNVGNITGGNNAGGMGLLSQGDEVVVERCENSGTIAGKDNTSGLFLQLGANNASFTDCYNGGAVTGGDAGGMVGELTYNNSKVSFRNCVNDAAITGGRPGGILGANDGKTIKGQFVDCVNNGKIHSTSNYGGGIAGRFDGKVAAASATGFESTAAGLFLRCVNNGEVEVFQSQGGGMVGYAAGAKEFVIEIRECLNTAYVHSTDLNKEVAVGGLVGSVGVPLTIYDSANTGKIHSGGKAGGIVGNAGLGSSIQRCVNTASVTGGVIAGGIAASTGGNGAPKNEVYYCVTTGLVTNTGVKVADKSHSTAGVVGYGWGGMHASYNVALGDVVANYPTTFATKPGNVLTVGAIAGYQNHSSGNYQNNYFAGTITCTNPDAVIIALKQTPGDNLDSGVGSKFINNFTSTALPLYYHRVAAGSDNNSIDDDTFGIATATSTAITQAIDSNDFLNTLNTAAGAGTFVMVTTCEGESFPIHKDTVAAFDLARTHADPDFDYYTNMKKDATHHWYECACCGDIAPEGKMEHEGGTATCQAAAVCSVCNTSYGDVDENNHVNEIVWSSDAHGHTGAAACCGASFNAEPHTFVNGVCTVCEYVCAHDVAHENSTPANCQSPAYCGVCEMSYGTTAGHEYDTEAWVPGTDGDANDKHYNPCKYCNAVDAASEQACFGGTATCTAAAVCEACGAAHGAMNPEVHSSTATYYAQDADDAMKCNLYHVCCDALIDSVEHEEGIAATCQSGAICANCEGEYGNRNYSNHTETGVTYQVCVNDATKHDTIHDCCGLPEAPAAHTGGTPTCKDPAKCALCGTAYGEPAGEHAYDDPCTDRFCNDCGTERTGMEHKFGEWTVTKAATDTEDGEQARVCESCGKTQTVTIAAGTSVNSALDSINTDAKGSDAYIGVIVIAVAGALVVSLVVAFTVHKKNKKK